MVCAQMMRNVPSKSLCLKLIFGHFNPNPNPGMDEEEAHIIMDMEEDQMDKEEDQINDLGANESAMETIVTILGRIKFMEVRNLKTQLPHGFPLNAIKDAMVLVMRHNIFEYGDLYFLHLLGTTMGTSAACMWATIYFAVHESNCLIPKYDAFLLLFKCFIDDMFGIWTGDTKTFACFQQDTNNFGTLTWEFKDLSPSCNFLDLLQSTSRMGR